jgi:FixJ family two-component response regulator
VPSHQDREDLLRFLADFQASRMRAFVTSRAIFTTLTDKIEGCLVLELCAPVESLMNVVHSLLERKPSLPDGLLKKGYNVKRLARIIANASSSSMCVCFLFAWPSLVYMFD